MLFSQVSKISEGTFRHPVERNSEISALRPYRLPAQGPKLGAMSDPPRIRRLKLVPRPEARGERPLSPSAAVRRYRLARMERVAEESPANADRPGPRAVPEREGRSAEGLG